MRRSLTVTTFLDFIARILTSILKKNRDHQLVKLDFFALYVTSNTDTDLILKL